MYKGFRIPIVLMSVVMIWAICLPMSAGGNTNGKELEGKKEEDEEESSEDPPDDISVPSILAGYSLVTLSTVSTERDLQSIINREKEEVVSKKKKKKPTPPKSIDELVKEVDLGKHGTGSDRKKSLGSQYDEVQKELNKKYKSKPKVKSTKVSSSQPTERMHPVEETKSVSNGKYGSELSPDQYEILLAVVQQESGGQDYNATLAVVSVMVNRVNSDKYQNDIWSVVTAPGQFEAYGAGHYHRRMGNITDITRQAVSDGLNGKTNVSYLNFWEKSYYSVSGRSDSNRTTIGGNTFFDF